MTEVNLSEEAEVDLENIYLYGKAQWGRAQAERYIDHLFEAFDDLADYPEAYRERADISPGLHMRPEHSHLIFYRHTRRQVTIIRVLHASVDAPNAVFPAGE